MRIGNLLKRSRPGVSFEFFPPKTEEGWKQLLEAALALKEYRPAFVSVTYGAGGSSRDRTRDALLRLRDLGGLTVMSHLTGIGATRAEIDHLLADYAANGVANILALRGDPPKNVEGFDASGGEFPDARELVAHIASYGAFSIGVAVYPEGHPEASSRDEEMEYTKRKIDAGADFAVTQMFFDNSVFYGFIDRIRRAGVRIPILPGIMPLADFPKIQRFATLCQATIPRGIADRLGRAWSKPEEARRIGLDMTVAQCEDLFRNGVRSLHFYTLNESRPVAHILDSLGKVPMAGSTPAAQGAG